MDKMIVLERITANEDLMRSIPKYHIGDKVMYIDIDGSESIGTIRGIEYTEVLPWVKEIKALYLISDNPYLRSEKQIMKVFS